jgi:selenide,water dikinase
MAVAVVPFASGAVMEGDLYQMMAGAATALREAGCALVGGHSCEGAELALGEHPGAGRPGMHFPCSACV